MSAAVIIDSGGANIASLSAALGRLGAESVVTTDHAVIRKAPRVLLPGVGSAHDAMSRLRMAGLDQVIRHVHVVDIPDAVSSWGQGGLLLTSKAGLALGPERQRALVPTLAAQGLVGLAVAAGTPPGDVPPSIRRSAE